MDIDFLKVSAKDKYSLWEAYREAMLQHIEQIWGWDEIWQKNDFNEKFQEYGTFFIVSESSNFGFIQMSVDESKIYINMIILNSKSRSKGIGGKVLTELNVRHPKKPIELRCFKVNKKAYEFYIKEGFTVIDDQSESYLMRRA